MQLCCDVNTFRQSCCDRKTLNCARIWSRYESLRSFVSVHARATVGDHTRTHVDALRWLRCLFSREFHIEDTLRLWDALFGYGCDDCCV
jgi:hypothetical protein